MDLLQNRGDGSAGTPIATSKNGFFRARQKTTQHQLLKKQSGGDRRQ